MNIFNLFKPKKERTSLRVIDTLIFVCIFLAFFLTPIFFTNSTSQGIGFEKLMLFIILVILGISFWAVKIILLGEINLRKSILNWLVIIPAILYIISAILGVAKLDSIFGSHGNAGEGLMAIVIFALFFFLTFNNLNEKRIKILFWALISSFSLVVVFELLQLSRFSIFHLGNAVNFTPLESLNSLAMFLIVGLPLLTVAAAQIEEIYPKLEKKKALAVKIFTSLVLLASLALLVALKGFTYWPMAFVSSVLILFFYFIKKAKISDKNLVVPFSVFLMIIALFTVSHFKSFEMNLPSEVSLSRGSSWSIAKKSLFENPLLGSGPSTFFYNFSKYRPLELNSTSLWEIKFNNASGIVLESLVSFGILGALSVMVLIILSLYFCFLGALKARKKDMQPLIVALATAYFSIVVFSLLFYINTSFILISLLFFVLAISASLTTYAKKNEKIYSFSASENSLVASLSVLVVAVLAVAFGYGAGRLFVADVYANRSTKNIPIEEKISYLSNAIKLFPYYDAYYLSLANNYTSLANNKKEDGNNEEIIKNINSGIDAGKKAIDLSPNKAANIEALALIYENAATINPQATALAEDYYKKALALNPINAASYLHLGAIGVFKSQMENDPSKSRELLSGALANYDKAIEKKTDFAVAYYGKAIIQELLNNQNEVVNELEKAVTYSQGNPLYRFELAKLYYKRAEADDLKKATQILLEDLVANPANLNARYQLALTYKKAGENDKANETVKSLLQLVTDEKDIEFIKKEFPDQ